MTDYAGIDYGLGRSNVDKDTGIRYGVISSHSVNPDAYADMESEYGPATCPKCGAEVKASDDPTLFDDYDGDVDDIVMRCGIEASPDGTPEWFAGKDFTCIACKACYWGDQCYADEPIGLSYDKDGYVLTDCLDSDIFVLKSPYFTFAQYCSPCVPGAGNLDTPMDAEKGVKTYCLGPDWFDADNPMPYRCYRVADGTEVVEGALA